MRRFYSWKKNVTRRNKGQEMGTRNNLRSWFMLEKSVCHRSTVYSISGKEAGKQLGMNEWLILIKLCYLYLFPMSVHTLPQPSFYSKLIYSSVSIHLLFLVLNLSIFPKWKQVIFLLVFLRAVQLPPCIKVRLNIHSPLSLLFICGYLILLKTWILKSATHSYYCLWKVLIHGYSLFLHFELYLVCAVLLVLSFMCLGLFIIKPHLILPTTSLAISQSHLTHPQFQIQHLPLFYQFSSCIWTNNSSTNGQTTFYFLLPINCIKMKSIHL